MTDSAKKSGKILDIFCASCGAPAEFEIARQTYRCRFCGSETGIGEALERKNEFRRLIRERIGAERQGFRAESAVCTGCGAEIVFAENEALTDCAFCGRKLVRGEYTKTEDFPELLIPFRITREEAKRRLLDWCEKNGRSYEAKAVKKNIDALEGFYLPYILVKGPVSCEVRRRDTSRVFRCRGFFGSKFVNLSTNLDNQTLDGAEPYDTSDLREFDFSFLAGHRVKIADIKEDDAAVRTGTEIAADYEPYAAKELETRAAAVKPDVGGMVKMSCVLPAYYLRCGDVVAAVNGQTGKVAVRERKDRFLLPWQLKPLAAIVALIGLTFLCTYFAFPEIEAAIFVTGALSIFFIVVVLTAYHDHYGGSSRFRLRRRILTSDDSRPDVAPPVFYEELDGAERPVRLKFTTPFRTLRMAALAAVVTFLPLVIAFMLNGFSFSGLTVAGAAVWLCIFVPVSPIYFIKFGRIDLHERPLIYTPDKNGRMRRYRRKPDFKAALFELKESLPILAIVIPIALIILIINVNLVLHWDDYGDGSDTGRNAESVSAAAETESVPQNQNGGE